MIISRARRTHRKAYRFVLIMAVGLVGVGVVVLLLRQSKESTAVPTCSTTSAAQQYVAADLVLTGEVFLVVPDGAENAKVLITPLRLYKGNVPAAGVAITAKAESGGTESDVTGELHFASGQPPYLLYLTQQANGLYTTSRCMGSRLLGEGLSSEEQQILGEGKKQ